MRVQSLQNGFASTLEGWIWNQVKGRAFVTTSASLAFPSADPESVVEGYRTDLGRMYQAKIEDFLCSQYSRDLRGQVQLIFTSPPFPLQTPKKYGNKVGEDYLNWLSDLAPMFKELLTPDGSIVIELGNVWEKGHPVMSTLPLRALLKFQDAGELHVNQQFICHNPARLPSPIEWVNKQRIRVKDTYTHVWWMASTERPKANNRNVLVEYSESMKKLIRTHKYNAGIRPSGHNIGAESFFKNNGGAIPANVLEFRSEEPEAELLDLLSEEFPTNVLQFSNTSAGTPYREYCREQGVPAHPAPMQSALASFFIRFLTDPGDIVLDPFGGSNTTGAVAEAIDRRWLAIEPNWDYIRGSVGRFEMLRGEAPLPESSPTLER